MHPSKSSPYNHHTCIHSPLRSDSMMISVISTIRVLFINYAYWIVMCVLWLIFEMLLVASCGWIVVVAGESFCLLWDGVKVNLCLDCHLFKFHHCFQSQYYFFHHLHYKSH